MKKINQSEAIGNNLVRTRRSFLKKSATGAILATLPAKSVWATNNMMSGTMSGNQSAWNTTTPISMMNESSWLPLLQHGSIEDEKFQNIFGATLVGVYQSDFPDKGSNYVANTRLKRLFNNPDRLGGPGDVNCLMACLYLNAKYSGMPGVYYPIAKPSEVTTGFTDEYDFASYLYGKAESNPYRFATELATLISQYA